MATGQKADPIFEIKGENIYLFSLSTGLFSFTPQVKRAERKINAPCEPVSETLPR